LIITKESNTKPAYLSNAYFSLKRKFKDIENIQVCQYSPHLGLIPLEISDVFPAAHHETSRLNFNPKEFPTFEDTWEIFFKNNQFSEIYFDKTDEFLKHYIKMLSKKIKKKSIV
jgi:7-cyano-7-deazaguanine tRNA-ribosyltransferase